jgi:hypothetical protein
MDLSTFSSLSSNPTTISSRLRGIEDDARKLSSLEDKNELVNSIGQMTSYFEEDYDWE